MEQQKDITLVAVKPADYSVHLEASPPAISTLGQGFLSWKEEEFRFDSRAQPFSGTPPLAFSQLAPVRLAGLFSHLN